MAKAGECDKPGCGKLFKAQHGNKFQLSSSDMDGNLLRPSMKGDLCPDCAADFLSLMQTEVNKFLLYVEPHRLEHFKEESK